MSTPILEPPALASSGTLTLPPSEQFVVRDYVQLGRKYRNLTVTYVGPNFLRLFGDVTVEAQSGRTVNHFTIDAWSKDEAVAPVIGPDAGLADLFALIDLGEDGPAGLTGESNTIYQTADGARWTPHFYTRGRRLGFGALPFGDAVGWEPGDVFLGGTPK